MENLKQTKPRNWEIIKAEAENITDKETGTTLNYIIVIPDTDPLIKIRQKIEKREKGKNINPWAKAERDSMGILP